MSDLKWISVWCRAFKVNFGDLYFPADLEIEAHAEPEGEAESEAESEPEGESSYIIISQKIINVAEKVKVCF